MQTNPRREILALALYHLLDINKALSSELICDAETTHYCSLLIGRVRKLLGPDLPKAAPPPGITDPLA
jgi:hypothetical protein